MSVKTTIKIVELQKKEKKKEILALNIFNELG